jgi:hypothetical protein
VAEALASSVGTAGSVSDPSFFSQATPANSSVAMTVYSRGFTVNPIPSEGVRKESSSGFRDKIMARKDQAAIKRARVTAGVSSADTQLAGGGPQLAGLSEQRPARLPRRPDRVVQPPALFDDLGGLSPECS